MPIYIVILFNVLAHQNLNWRTPTEMGLGYTPEIAPFLQFEFYEPMYCLNKNPIEFPVEKENLVDDLILRKIVNMR